jgi:putative phage-type endonuclease
MAQILVATKEMTRDEWLDWRKHGIGGSDASAVAGLNPYKSPVQVYLEKIGDMEIEEAGESAYWGTMLEDMVAQEFSKRTGMKVQRKNAILQHPEYQHMIANIDRLIVGEDKPGILECKTANAWSGKDWEEGKIPPQYIIQVQHYLAVTGYEYAYIAALVGGQKFFYYKIDRDQELIDYLVKIESVFWQMVQDRMPPEVDGSEASSDLLKKLYPIAEDRKEIDMPAEASLLLDAYEQVKAEIKELEQRKDELENKLKAMMADAEIGKAGKRIVEWKNVNANRFDSKSFQKDMPGLYENYVKLSPYRKFSIKTLKGD